MQCYNEKSLVPLTIRFEWLASRASVVENLGTFDSFTVNDRPVVASSTKAFTTRLHVGVAWFYVD